MRLQHQNDPADLEKLLRLRPSQLLLCNDVCGSQCCQSVRETLHVRPRTVNKLLYTINNNNLFYFHTFPSERRYSKRNCFIFQQLDSSCLKKYERIEISLITLNALDLHLQITVCIEYFAQLNCKKIINSFDIHDMTLNYTDNKETRILMFLLTLYLKPLCITHYKGIHNVH